MRYKKKTPQGVFFLFFGWASRIRTYIAGTKNQSPAIGRWPSMKIDFTIGSLHVSENPQRKTIAPPFL